MEYNNNGSQEIDLSDSSGEIYFESRLKSSQMKGMSS